MTKVVWLVLLLSKWGISHPRSNNYTWIQVKDIVKSKFYSFDGIMRGTEDAEIYAVKLGDKWLTALVDNSYPYVYLNERSDFKISGYVGELWDAMEEYLGFKYRLINSSNTQRILEGTADLSLIPVIMRADHYEEFDLTHSLGKSWYNFYLEAKLHDTHSIYSRIWSEEILFCIGGLLLLCALVQWFTIKWSFMKADSGCNYEAEEAFSSYTAVTTMLLNVYGCCLQQGVQFRTAVKGVEIPNFLCAVFGLLVSTSYSAILISRIFANQQSDSQISMMKLRDSPPTICIAEGSRVYKALNETPYDGPEFLLRFKESFNRYPCSGYKSTMVDVKNFCKTGTVNFEEHHNFNRHSRKGKIRCKLVRDPEKYFTVHLSLLMKKRSAYKELINKLLIKMITNGILVRIRNKWLPTREKETEWPTNIEYSASFLHTQELILTYLYFVSFSTFLLAVEILYYRFNKNVKIDLTYFRAGFRSSSFFEDKKL